MNSSYRKNIKNEIFTLKCNFAFLFQTRRFFESQASALRDKLGMWEVSEWKIQLKMNLNIVLMVITLIKLIEVRLNRIKGKI